MKPVVLHYIALIFLITLTLVGVVISYQFLAPINVISIDNPVKVKTEHLIKHDGYFYPSVHRGNDLIVYYHYEKFLPYPEHTFRSLMCDTEGINSVLVYADDIFKNHELGDHIVEFNHFKIPEDTPLNVKCHVRYLIEYDINVFRKVTVRTQTEPFYVVEEVQE